MKIDNDTDYLKLGSATFYCGPLNSQFKISRTISIIFKGRNYLRALSIIIIYTGRCQVPFAPSCEILIDVFICYKQTKRHAGSSKKHHQTQSCSNLLRYARCLPVEALVRSFNINTSYNGSPCYIDNSFTRSVKGMNSNITYKY